MRSWHQAIRTPDLIEKLSPFNDWWPLRPQKRDRDRRGDSLQCVKFTSGFRKRLIVENRTVGTLHRLGLPVTSERHPLQLALHSLLITCVPDQESAMRGRNFRLDGVLERLIR